MNSFNDREWFISVIRSVETPGDDGRVPQLCVRPTDSGPLGVKLLKERSSKAETFARSGGNVESGGIGGHFEDSKGVEERKRWAQRLRWSTTPPPKAS